MRENLYSKGRRYGQLAFMSAVTSGLLALVFVQAAKGAAGLPGVAVYALAAGFGLEFVGAAWTGRWREPGQRSSQHN